MRSWKTPTPDQVERAVALLAIPAQRWEFFTRLDNPLWIEPLRARGFFDTPPAAIENTAEGTVQFPAWPEAVYLARVAGELPTVAVDTALRLPETNNTRILVNLIELAERVPLAEVGRLLPRILEAIGSTPYPEMLARPGAKLAAHLLTAGNIAAGLSVADELLAVAPPSAGVREAGGLSTPRLRISEWEFGEALETLAPAVVEAGATEAIELLGARLKDYLVLSDRVSETSDQDISSLWRPAIESHSQNAEGDPEDSLVVALRDIAEGLVSTRRVEVASVVGQLETLSLVVFKRIALHVLATRVLAGDETVMSLVSERLLNRSLFVDDSYRHEYFRLLQAAYPKLPADLRSQILSWIAEGPELDDWSSRVQQEKRRSPSAEERATRIGYWQLEKLAPIAEHLDADWQQRHADLTAWLGTPEHPDFSSYTSTGVGPTTPLGQSELSGMTLDAVLEYLRSWQPPEGLWEPSREGLARTLTEVVKGRAAEFSEQAREFVGLDPTYVRAALGGLREAVREGVRLDLAPVLDLMLWILEQPRDDFRKGDRDSDPGWGWSRTEVARLLSDALETESGVLDEFRLKVWNLIEVLSDDPDPSPEHEAKYGGENMNPANFAINTTRGVAMQAVFAYVRSVELDRRRKGMEEGGLEHVPEAVSVLDRHLDPAVDPSPSVRSQYGRALPLMLAVDPGWVRENIGRLFPKADGEAALRNAVWLSFVVFGGPSLRALDVLAEEYRWYLENDSGQQRRLSPGHPKGPAFDLVQHVVAYYWWGEIEFHSDDRLLETLFERAPAEAAAYAMEYVGRSLRNLEGNLESGEADRLRHLWEARCSRIEEEGPLLERRAELAAFGWWFSAGRLDKAWSLNQLLRVLKLEVFPDWPHEVVERLAEHVDTQPLEALDALERMVTMSTHDPWALHSVHRESHQVLRRAFALDSSDVDRVARRVVDGFVRRGFEDFRALRPSRTGE